MQIVGGSSSSSNSNTRPSSLGDTSKERILKLRKLLEAETAKVTNITSSSSSSSSSSSTDSTSSDDNWIEKKTDQRRKRKRKKTSHKESNKSKDVDDRIRDIRNLTKQSSNEETVKLQNKFEHSREENDIISKLQQSTQDNTRDGQSHRSGTFESFHSSNNDDRSVSPYKSGNSETFHSIGDNGPSVFSHRSEPSQIITHSKRHDYDSRHKYTERKEKSSERDSYL